MTLKSIVRQQKWQYVLCYYQLVQPANIFTQSNITTVITTLSFKHAIHMHEFTYTTRSRMCRCDIVNSIQEVSRVSAYSLTASHATAAATGRIIAFCACDVA